MQYGFQWPQGIMFFKERLKIAELAIYNLINKQNTDLLNDTEQCPGPILLLC